MSLTSQPVQREGDSPEAREYNRIRRRLAIADFAVGLAMLVVLVATRWTNDLRDWAYLGAGESYVLALFFYVLMLAVIAKVLGLGFDLYSFILEHRFQLSNQKFGSWVWDEFKGWLVGFVFAVLAAQFVYWMMRVDDRWWWLISWAVFVVIFVLLAQLAPVLLFPIFFKFKPLENESLKQRLVRLGERAGTRVRGVYEWKLSEKSKKANAALTGLGKTRRILLADTLLENYSEDEIEAVMAHELGHHVHGHIVKSIVVQAVITFIGFWLAARVLHFAVKQRMMFGTDRISDFADLPLLALVSTVVSVLLIPALNAWSRHNERQADTYAFKSIPKVEPFITSMNKLADQNLAERNPSRWVELFFHSHPAISKRIAAAKSWKPARSGAK
ncbi:MAG TPA: M48 family metallopeptidase [Terriglobales bacterium]|nr:M48 family metallopeptidase [Terriglobales bacterium]